MMKSVRQRAGHRHTQLSHHTHTHTHTRARTEMFFFAGSCKRPETASGCKGFVKHITATQLQCFLNLHGDNTLNAAQEWPTALGSVWFRGCSSMWGSCDSSEGGRLWTTSLAHDNPPTREPFRDPWDWTSKAVRLYSNVSRAPWGPRTMQWNKAAKITWCRSCSQSTWWTKFVNGCMFHTKRTKQVRTFCVFSWAAKSRSGGQPWIYSLSTIVVGPFLGCSGHVFNCWQPNVPPIRECQNPFRKT